MSLRPMSQDVDDRQKVKSRARQDQSSVTTDQLPFRRPRIGPHVELPRVV